LRGLPGPFFYMETNTLTPEMEKVETPLKTDVKQDIPVKLPESPTLDIFPDDLAKEILGKQMGPEVPAPTFEHQPEIKNEKDRDGKTFDPNTHAANPDGTPKKNKFGNFYRKDVGRKRNSPETQESASINETKGTGNIPIFNENRVDEYEAMAETCLRLGDGAMVSILTDDVKLEDPEFLTLKTALVPALRSSGIKDIPPWMAFSLVGLGIYLPKLQKPKAKERVGIIINKIKGRRISHARKTENNVDKGGSTTGDVTA
jgi:hypothetical protein